MGRENPFPLADPGGHDDANPQEGFPAGGAIRESGRDDTTTAGGVGAGRRGRRSGPGGLFRWGWIEGRVHRWWVLAVVPLYSCK